MKLANLHLVTGYAGYEHVTAADQGAFNVALLGSEQFVINKGSKLAASVITNNKIRIADGDSYMQGRFIRLNEGTYVDLAIDNGAQGKKRNDLIVARYTKDSVSGVEEVNLVVIKGTAVASTSNPADPAYNSSNIVEGKGYLNDMPLYRVPIDGLNVQTLVPLFTVKSLLIPTSAEDVGARPNTWMPTAAEVGAAKVYNSLAELGLTESTVTMNGILTKMAVPSKLVVYTSSSWASGVVPEYNGTLVVEKVHNARVSALFISSYATVGCYVGTATSGNTFGGWQKVFHAGNKPTAADVGAVSKSGDTMTGFLEHLDATSGRTARVAYSTSGCATLMNRQDVSNSAAIRIYPETVSKEQAITFATNEGGTPKEYPILHTGNITENGVAKIECGSYVGTSATTAPTLTFSFKPKLVIVINQNSAWWGDTENYGLDRIFWIEGMTKETGPSGTYGNYNRVFTANGNTLTWRIDTSSGEGWMSANMNNANSTYSYIAIG